MSISSLFTRYKNFPLFYCVLDQNNNYIIKIHPAIKSSLDKKIQDEVKYHINKTVNLLKNNLDISDF